MIIEQQENATGDSRSARLVELLGDDIFFVPCAWGTKTPLVTYKERPFEATKSPADLAENGRSGLTGTIARNTIRQL